MIFFMAMPFVIGLMNFAVPLQLGVRDVAFPTLNSVSFWLTASGALLINISLAIGEFAKTGWMAYPPLSELAILTRRRGRTITCGRCRSPASALCSRNQFRHNHPEIAGTRHGYMRMPVFCWTALRHQSAHRRGFSGPDCGPRDADLLDPLPRIPFLHDRRPGQPELYVNLFWVWGHPEVYILILPAFGVFSRSSRPSPARPLFGYRSMWARPWAICVSFLPRLAAPLFHMGASAGVNAFFAS